MWALTARGGWGQDKADTVAELNWLCHPMWQAGRELSRRGEGPVISGIQIIT